MGVLVDYSDEMTRNSCPIDLYRMNCVTGIFKIFKSNSANYLKNQTNLKNFEFSQIESCLPIAHGSVLNVVNMFRSLCLFFFNEVRRSKAL